MNSTLNINGAPVELIDLDQMAMMYTKQNRVDTWLVDTFFPGRQRFDGKSDIPVGALETSSPLAPFVVPCSEHQPITGVATGRVDYIKPAYLKPKETVTVCDIFDANMVKMYQAAGIVPATGAFSPADRMRLDAGMKFARLRESIDNRKTLMAAELISTGQIVMRSDNFPQYIVDYGRDSSAVFNPTVLWSNSSATPVQDINTMLERINDLSGPGQYVLTTTAVWNSLLKHNDFNDTFVKPYAGISVPYIQTMQTNPTQAAFRGFLPGTQTGIWTYDAQYKLANGTRQRFLPNGFFGVISGTGLVAQAQIESLGAYGQALDYYDSREEKVSPSAVHMYCESAPLLVPSSANWIVGGVNFI